MLNNKIKEIIRKVSSQIFIQGLLYYGNKSDIYLTQNQMKFYERKLAFSKVLTLTQNIEGDYLEFGVYEGDSFLMAFNYIDKIIGDKKSRFFGFDSFEGLPEVNSKSDIEAGWKKGDMVSSYEKTLSRIKKTIPQDRFELIQGYYETSLTSDVIVKLKLEKIKILMIDCDMYSSTKLVLDFCQPFLDYGSVIIFDDYYYNSGDPKIGGEAKAFDEFLKDSKYIAHPYCSYGFAGKIFVLHKKHSEIP